MKTKVTFQYLEQGEVKFKDLEIEHPEFKELPSEEFMNYKFNPVTVDNQVIDYLDSIDKRDLMIEHGMYLVLDYFIPKKMDEVTEFFNFIKPYIKPESYAFVEGLIYESRSILFGKGKSNEDKAKELVTLMNISKKSIDGVFNMINDLLNDTPKLEFYDY